MCVEAPSCVLWSSHVVVLSSRVEPLLSRVKPRTVRLDHNFVLRIPCSNLLLHQLQLLLPPPCHPPPPRRRPHMTRLTSCMVDGVGVWMGLGCDWAASSLGCFVLVGLPRATCDVLPALLRRRGHAFAKQADAASRHANEPGDVARRSYPLWGRRPRLRCNGGLGRRDGARGWCPLPGAGTRGPHAAARDAPRAYLHAHFQGGRAAEVVARVERHSSPLSHPPHPPLAPAEAQGRRERRPAHARPHGGASL